MSERWSTLETHVVNGVFPLQRCVGSTDHSGVFLTQSTPHAPSAVALKLVPFDPPSASAQLARWQSAVELSHPHLLRMFEAGQCRVDGLDYLYARMEFADQTLAQVLERRPLTEEEARDMLAPALDALAYLHQRNRIHGGLKPSNILVVGNQLKLASDTVRAAEEPDADATSSADVHALGLMLCEALTRVRPSSLDGAGGVALPAELPMAFRELVARCLSFDPQQRPTVAELQAWLQGDALAAPVPTPAQSAATRLVVRVELPSSQSPEAAAVAEPGRWRVLPLVICAMVLAALGWFGYRKFSTPRVDTPPAAAVVPVPAPLPTPVPAAVPPPVATATVPPPPASRDAPVDEVMPKVSQSSLDTIRGTIRVSVRVTVGADGRVASTIVDDAGPSRYFERRSLDAAKQWTFAPSTENERSMQVRFAFTRSGVTASARPTP